MTRTDAIAGNPIPTDRVGRFARADATFRSWIGDPDFPAAAGRYHLVLAHACPWCHRTLLVRDLKGLQDVVSVSFVHPDMGDKGWHFDPATHPDPLYNESLVRAFYFRVDPDYAGRFTVPILWDTERGTMVSNESSEIIRMLTTEFDAWSSAPELDLYPEPLRQEIDAVNARIYDTVNNGVYKCGFAKSQQAYEEAFHALFDSLDWLEQRLTDTTWLVGDRMTEADWRLFPTLIRFDAVYHTHFKCNGRRLVDYPALQEYTERLYRLDGIADATRFDEIKQHYYRSHRSLNPLGIVPVGPLHSFSRQER